MPNHSKKDIIKFQKLYLRYYGKILTLEESEKRLDSLVRLLRLIRDVPSKKHKSNIILNLNIKNKPAPEKDVNTVNENLSEPN